MATPETIDMEPDDPATALALRAPAIPVTLGELAAMKSAAIEIIDARVQVVTTLRTASIRATSPPDWLLFKSPDEQGGQVVRVPAGLWCRPRARPLGDRSVRRDGAGKSRRH